MDYPWGHKRRINFASNYTKKVFGSRVQKVTLDAGFTCPNRDGTISTGGCTFCNNNAFNPSYCQPEKSITEQIREGVEFHKSRYRSVTKYMVYFQKIGASNKFSRHASCHRSQEIRVLSTYRCVLIL